MFKKQFTRGSMNKNAHFFLLNQPHCVDNDFTYKKGNKNTHKNETECAQVDQEFIVQPQAVAVAGVAIQSSVCEIQQVLLPFFQRY